MFRVVRYEKVGLTLRAQEVDVGGSEEAAQQGPDEDLGADSVDTGATTEDHDESGEPFTSSSETASNVTVLQWCNLGTIDPAGAKPTEGEDDLVKNNDGDSTPIRAGGLLVGWEGCEDHVDEHADTTSKGRPRKPLVLHSSTR